MHARVAWAALLGLVVPVLVAMPAAGAAVVPATAGQLVGAALDPSPVPSVAVSNPAPDLLLATWVAPTSGDPATGYVVRVRSLDTAVVEQRTTSELTESFTVAPGQFYVTVAAVGAGGEVAETASSPVVVSGLVRTGTVSASMVRPFRDGFQDTVTLRATSSFPDSGSVRVLDASGAVVRAIPLATATAWSAAFDGRTAAGRALPFGYYRLKFVLGGTVVATRGVTVASSQVGPPTHRWSAGRFFPVVDGYRDTVRLTVGTGVPATMKVVIRGITGAARGKVVGVGRLSRRTTGTFTWNGRRHGRVAPAGTYRATITVLGGEGRPRTTTTSVSVSAKRRAAQRFDLTVAAVRALDSMAYGSVASGSDSGGQRLRGCSTAGCEPDMGLYSSTLPASVSPYTGVKVTVCVRTTSGAPQGRFGYTDPRRGVVGPVYSFGTGGAGCYVPGVSPGSAVSGRTIFWLAANVDTGSRSVLDVAYFRLTGTRYVLS